MKLTSQSFTDGARIPGEFAVCIPAEEGHVCLGGNRNPQLSWTEVPAGTSRSTPRKISTGALSLPSVSVTLWAAIARSGEGRGASVK